MVKKSSAQGASNTATSRPDGEHPDDVGLEQDARRAEVLRELGPASPEYVDFGLRMRSYGINVLIKQWVCDELRGVVAKKTGLVLPSPLECWQLEDIRSMVGVSVSRTVEPFMEAAIMQGGWDPTKKARIRTFFLGRCYYSFADEYRREHGSERAAQLDLKGRAFDHELDVVRYVQRSKIIEDPEQTAVNRAEIRRLLNSNGTHRRIPEIIFLKSRDLTCGEIARHLGMTETAVSKALSRFHSDITSSHRRAR